MDITKAKELTEKAELNKDKILTKRNKSISKKAIRQIKRSIKSGAKRGWSSIIWRHRESNGIVASKLSNQVRNAINNHFTGLGYTITISHDHTAVTVSWEDKK